MLHKLQQQFKDFVLAANDDLVADITSPNAEARLRVYRNNYFGNLIDALKITYPMFCNLGGEPFFRSCAKHYIKQHPPEAMDLMVYGYDFHEFIAQMDLPKYFSELVKFESLLDICHHRGESQQMQSIYNIHDVYEFCKAQDESASLDLLEGNYSFLIYREDYLVKYKASSIL